MLRPPAERSRTVKFTWARWRRRPSFAQAIETLGLDLDAAAEAIEQMSATRMRLSVPAQPAVPKIVLAPTAQVLTQQLRA